MTETITITNFRVVSVALGEQICERGGATITTRGRKLFVFRGYIPGDAQACQHTWGWTAFKKLMVREIDKLLETGSILLTVDGSSRFVVELP